MLCSSWLACLRVLPQLEPTQSSWELFYSTWFTGFFFSAGVRTSGYPCKAAAVQLPFCLCVTSGAGPGAERRQGRREEGGIAKISSSACVCVQAILGCREAAKTGWGCCCAAGVERPCELLPAPRSAARRPQGCVNILRAPVRAMPRLSEGSALDLQGP